MGHAWKCRTRAAVIETEAVSHAFLGTDVGQLIVAGFDGTELPAAARGALARGELGGIILFRRNLTGDPLEVAAVTGAARDAASGTLPPFVCIDQEGGRVARLGPPIVRLPPMLHLAGAANADLVKRAGHALGRDLAALGFSSGLGPVLDVHSNPQNPVIGDRAFGESAEPATTFALAFAAGLQEAGVAVCGKHFPGHGDTSTDSHFTLPVVTHGRERLDAVEFAPFRGAAKAGFDAMMTAHVLYTSLDRERPATLSRIIATDLLRGALGFQGVLFSDDLEMKALTLSIEESAVAAIEAGCDALLVCSRLDLAERAREALVRRCEASGAFRARCEEAFGRFAVLRRRVAPRPMAPAELSRHFAAPERAIFAEELRSASSEFRVA